MCFAPFRRSVLIASILVLMGCGGYRYVPFIGEKPQFKFVQISDTHYMDNKSTYVYLNKVVDELNLLRDEVDFVAITGDLTTDGKRSELRDMRRILDRLQLEWFAIPGNHDMDRENWLKYFPHYDSYSYEHKGAHLIFLDSTEPSGTIVSLSEKKFDFLESDLHRVEKHTPVLLFIHHPVAPGIPKYRVKNADRVLDTFKKHNLTAVIAGHYHANWECEVDGVYYTSIACLTDSRNNHDGSEAKGYRIFTVDGNNVTSRFVEFKP
jgi:3',5'-cyclic AMP phosphodiesterase CpdA